MADMALVDLPPSDVDTVLVAGGRGVFDARDDRTLVSTDSTPA
jgi:hypothetical protein